jgi:predicted metal-dependent hydrolase
MILFLILLTLILVVVYFYFFNRFEIVQVGSKTYKIEKDVTPSRRSESLMTLANIRTKLDQLVESMIGAYPSDPKIARMKERFLNTILQEANPAEENEKFKDAEAMLKATNGEKKQTSYTINKGDVMVLCIRNVDGNLVDINTLMYVAIHELAHILSSSLNHTPEFWQNMKLLKDHAVKIKLYVDRDYKTNPVPYCGIPIDSNIS